MTIFEDYIDKIINIHQCLLLLQHNTRNNTVTSILQSYQNIPHYHCIAYNSHFYNCFSLPNNEINHCNVIYKYKQFHVFIHKLDNLTIGSNNTSFNIH